MKSKALLVGINAYPGCPLRGCVNDVENVAQLLTQKYGFQLEDIRIVTDGRATTGAIRDRLQWLMAGIYPGDRIVFHYSGHGSQLALRDANSGSVTALHDCICPVDFDFTTTHALTDLDFATIFSTLPQGVIFDWLSDSCHSGDLTRGLPTFCRSGLIAPRAFDMPLDMRWRIDTAKSLGMQPTGFARSIEHLHGAFISGCRSDQTSADAFIDGKPCGAFTDTAVKAISDGQFVRGAIVSIVRQELKTSGYDQEPQLRGDPDAIAKPWLS